MSAYIGEIRMFAGAKVPDGWMMCNGQYLDIQTHIPLFALIGTTYGGDGVRSFALPDLRGRIPIHLNEQMPLGQWGGEETHALLSYEMPAHGHALMGSSQTAVTAAPANAVLGAKGRLGRDVMGPVDTQMSYGAVAYTGASEPHENMPPYLVLNFIIAVDDGIFPPRS